MADVFELQEYINENGQNKFRSWILSLDKSVRNRINIALTKARLGNLGDHKSVGNGLFEIRLDFGAGYRIYYYKDGAKLIILLCGGDKSSQKKDIKQAKEYLVEYIRRTHE